MEKGIQIKFEEKTYSGKLSSTDSQVLNAELSSEMFSKFTGNINLKSIYEQIIAFEDSSMEEIFSSIKELSQDNLNLKKESDKYILDIKFIILKKERHLIIDLNQVEESLNSIIHHLIKMVQESEADIKILEKEISELKNIMPAKTEKKDIENKKNKEIKENKENKENKKNKEIKEIKKEPKQPEIISNYIQKDISIIKALSLLILSDGRISIGTKGEGIYIYEPDNFKECIHIENCGPIQAELKKGILLVKKENSIEIIELSQKGYKIKMKINYLFYYEPLYIEVIESNCIAHGLISEIYILNFPDDYEKYNKREVELEDLEKYIINLPPATNCKFILRLNSEKMAYIVSDNSLIKKLVFYNYKDKVEIKTINIYVDVENKAISKINDNLLAACDSTKITLIDINQHKVVKLFDIYKNILCLYSLENKYLIISVIDDESEKSFLQKYKVNEEGNSLMLIKEKKDIKVDSFVKSIGLLNNDNFVLLSYLGSVQFMPEDEI